MSISVVIAAFGDLAVWGPLADRAQASAREQTVAPTEIIRGYGSDLRDARNSGARAATGDHLVFLDADDELDPGYVAAMEESIARTDGPAVHRPSTIGVHPDGSCDPKPNLIPERDMRTANCAVIGSACPRDLFEQVGGFGDYQMLEDWALWRRMIGAGASLVSAPAAIYRVHIYPGSRNSDPHRQGGRIYRRIVKECPL